MTPDEVHQLVKGYIEAIRYELDERYRNLWRRVDSLEVNELCLAEAVCKVTGAVRNHTKDNGSPVLELLYEAADVAGAIAAEEDPTLVLRRTRVGHETT